MYSPIAEMTKINKCIGDDTKAAARQSRYYILKNSYGNSGNSYGEKRF